MNLKPRKVVDGVYAIYHPLYVVWNGMRRRCLSPGATGYDNYGGRGIRVCEQWGDFECFVRDMGPRPSKHHTIDRIDNDGNYEPSVMIDFIRACKARSLNKFDAGFAGAFRTKNGMCHDAPLWAEMSAGEWLSLIEANYVTVPKEDRQFLEGSIATQ